MALNISLIGDEAKEHVLSILAAMHAYVHGPAPVAAPVDSTPPVDNSAAEAAAASAEAAATSKKAAAAKKAAEKKAADEAAAAAASAKEAEAATIGEPERDYAVEELRALAGELNVDATRAATIAVLAGVGAKSVTALGDMTPAVRCDVFDKLTAILDEAKSAAATLN